MFILVDTIRQDNLELVIMKVELNILELISWKKEELNNYLQVVIILGH